jgi:hypothetical protein
MATPPNFPPASPGPPPIIHEPSQPDMFGEANASSPPPSPAPGQDQGQVVSREPPEPDEARKELVEKWASKVRSAKRKWDPYFKKMLRDQKFCAGKQWPEETKSAVFNDELNDRYIANITLRHVKQRVAAVYAKNPRVVAKVRPRLLATVWDGTMQGLQQAQQTMQQAQVAQEAQQKLGLGIGLGLAAAKAGVPLNTLAGKPEFTWQDPSKGTPPGAPGAPNPAPNLMSMLSPQPGQAPIFPPPQPPPPDELAQAQAVIADAQQVKAQFDQLQRIAKTLQLLFEYEISQQQQSFKIRMKMATRRAATSGIGWVRVGFQRVMAPNPDLDSKLGDGQSQIQFMAKVAADIADGIITEDSPEAEQMRLVAQSMAQASEIVAREGLIFSWPKSTAIIPDEDCVALRDFLGCNWVAEEFCLSPDEIQKTYGVDVGKKYTAYSKSNPGSDWQQATPRNPSDTTGVGTDDSYGIVWEIFNKDDGLVYTVCDGYCDFLREPAEPEFYTDRFWPWFLIAFNETDGEVWPQSDVNLVRPMQLELNRSRQGLREHRFANRPKIAYSSGVLSAEDIEALKNPPTNAVIAVDGLQPGQDINQLLQAIKGAPIDPNIYETNETFQDMLRVAGDQQADLGPTSGATATESNIAAQARATSTGSEIDDIDDTLSSLAQSAGQILLLNVSQETVQKIVGPGAVWPQLTKSEVAQQLYLDIEAGSSGRPDQARELQNFERIAPILMQIPGISPNFLAKEALTRLDDNIDLEDAVADGQPSIMAQNAVQPGASTGPPGSQPPGAQGPRGVSNAPAPPSPNSSAPSPANAETNAPPSMPN